MDKTIDYSVYSKMYATPAGDILQHILKRLEIKQSALARGVNILPQRVYDLIKGNRRFTPDISMAIERYLGIDIKGFFYMSQSRHDIYLEDKAKVAEKKINISVFRPATFWEYQLDKIDWDKGKENIVTRVLEYGNKEEIDEVLRYYGTDFVKTMLSDRRNFRNFKNVIQKINEYGYGYGTSL